MHPMHHKAPRPTARIADVDIHGDLILAPMAGYSDLPFRTLCRQMGSAMSYTPCALDEAVVRPSRRTREILTFVDAERPVAIQVIGKDADSLRRAGLRAAARRPDLIDVNMGCPARRVASGGRGAALLREPERIGRIVSHLVESLPVPVTAKIRLGWDAGSCNHVDVARTLEEAGAAAIAVHGRTRQQGYAGCADWEAIADVRRAVSVPVIANGDVRTPSDIDAIKAATGCDLVMVGRGAIGNPWIFARRDATEVPMTERAAMMRRHLAAMQRFYGERTGLILFRKHAVRYVRHVANVAHWRRALGTAQTTRELWEVLDALVEAHER